MLTKEKKKREKKLIPSEFSKRQSVIQQKKAMDHYVSLTDMHLTAAGARLLPNHRLLSLPGVRNMTHKLFFLSFFLGNPAPREDPMLSKRSYL